MTDGDSIDGILDREKGYVDMAADKGGPTNMGITLPILSAWRGTACTVADLQAMQVIEARAIYEDQFITRPGFDRIQDDALRDEVVDAGVNHSPARAIKWLQEIVAVPDDGVLGPVSLRAINGADPHKMRARFIAQRTRFFGRLIADDANRLKRDHGIDTQGEFAAGWLERCAGFIDQL